MSTALTLDDLPFDAFYYLWRYLSLRDKFSLAKVNTRLNRLSSDSFSITRCLELLYRRSSAFLPGITRLCINRVPDSGVENLFRHLSDLEKLSLRFIYDTDFATQQHYSKILIHALKHCCKLTSLTCDNLTLNRDHIPLLHCRAPLITEIYFSRMTRYFQENFYDLLQSFTNLRSFTLDSLSSQVYDSRFYPSVITLPMFPESLEEFSVTGILHTSIHFLFAHCENITSFAYFHTCASPYGFLYSELYVLRSMTNLVSLKIPHSSISDVDFNVICEKMVNIKTLNISACFEISQSGLEKLGKLSKLRNLSVAFLKIRHHHLVSLPLETLDVSHCHNHFLQIFGLILEMPNLHSIMFESSDYYCRECTNYNRLCLESLIPAFCKEWERLNREFLFYIPRDNFHIVAYDSPLYTLGGFTVCHPNNFDSPCEFVTLSNYYCTLPFKYPISESSGSE